jgi:[ribosomal protein S5]-alanine N-acetyltransferase
VSVCETGRLILRRMTRADAEFILELLNEPAFLENIGDKGARTIDDACRYILTGPVASYEQYGFGLWVVELKEPPTPIGMCGLLKRESMHDVEIGFAFLSRFCQQGYASESAAAVMALGRETFGLKRISAITAPDNLGSMNVLRKVGLKFQEMIRLPEYETDRTLFMYEAD